MAKKGWRGGGNRLRFGTMKLVWAMICSLVLAVTPLAPVQAQPAASDRSPGCCHPGCTMACCQATPATPHPAMPVAPAPARRPAWLVPARGRLGDLGAALRRETVHFGRGRASAAAVRDFALRPSLRLWCVCSGSATGPT